MTGEVDLDEIATREVQSAPYTRQEFVPLSVRERDWLVERIQELEDARTVTCDDDLMRGKSYQKAKQDVAEALREREAERDRLHDALTEVAIEEGEHPQGGRALRCRLCETADAYADSSDEVEHFSDCLLREVEQGDTVERIRREAFEEAAEVADNYPWGMSSYKAPRKPGDATQAAAKRIRALAEADDGGENDE